MKIINKIKAFFCKDNEPMELDLIAAEVKEGRAYLHTRGETKTTYMVRSNDIRISLSEGKSLSALDIFSIVPKKRQEDTSKANAEKEKPTEKEQTVAGVAENAAISAQKQPSFTFPGLEKYKKRTFSVSLYPEEYENLINSMKESGYKRADFLLACVQSARKASVEKAHKEIVKTHKQMLIEQKELIAQQIAELENATPAV